jgi:hypothetical protein
VVAEVDVRQVGLPLRNSLREAETVKLVSMMSHVNEEEFGDLWRPHPTRDRVLEEP